MGDAMSDATTPAMATSATTESDTALPRLSWFHPNTELVIALLLGLASIVTAYASFQSSLFDGEVNRLNTAASVLSGEAESLYLEANQQYVSDAQLFDRLTELAIGRAANAVPEGDPRPTGPRQLSKAAAHWQRDLESRRTSTRSPASWAA